jgi:hypothetical protein
MRNEQDIRSVRRVADCNLSFRRCIQYVYLGTHHAYFYIYNLRGAFYSYQFKDRDSPNHIYVGTMTLCCIVSDACLTCHSRKATLDDAKNTPHSSIQVRGQSNINCARPAPQMSPLFDPIKQRQTSSKRLERAIQRRKYTQSL